MHDLFVHHRVSQHILLVSQDACNECPNGPFTCDVHSHIARSSVVSENEN